MCLFMGSIAAVAAVFFPITSDINTAIALIWVVLFCGAFIMPILVGVMLAKVKPDMRAKANSFSNLMYNLFGFFPSPLVYGLANTLIGGGKEDSRWGMRIIMYSVSIIIVFVVLAMCSDKNTNYKNICCKKDESELEDYDSSYVRMSEKVDSVKVDNLDD